MLTIGLLLPSLGQIIQALDAALDTVEGRALNPREHLSETVRIVPTRLALTFRSPGLRHSFTPLYTGLRVRLLVLASSNSA